MTSFSSKKKLRSLKAVGSQEAKILCLQIAQVIAPFAGILSLGSLISFDNFGRYLQLNALVSTAATVAFGAFEILLLQVKSSEDVPLLLRTEGIRRYFLLASLAFLSTVLVWLHFVSSTTFSNALVVSLVSLLVAIQVLIRGILVFSNRYFEATFLVFVPYLLFTGYCLMTSVELDEVDAFLVWLISNAGALCAWGLYRVRNLSPDGIRRFLTWGFEGDQFRHFEPPFTLMQINSSQLIVTGWVIPAIATFEFQGELDAVVSGFAYLTAALTTLLLSLAVREQQFGRTVSARESGRIVTNLAKLNLVVLAGCVLSGTAACWYFAGSSTILTSFLVLSPMNYVLLKMSEISLLKIYLVRAGETFRVRRQMLIGAGWVIVAVVFGVGLNPVVGVYLGAGAVYWLVRALNVLHRG